MDLHEHNRLIEEHHARLRPGARQVSSLNTDELKDLIKEVMRELMAEQEKIEKERLESAQELL